MPTMSTPPPEEPPRWPTTPPPSQPPAGYQPPWPQQPPQQMGFVPPPYQPPPGYVVPPQFRQPGDWWYDGKKWRPPVGAQPTRWELISQVPGKIIGLIVLGFLLWVLLAALGIVH